MDLSGMIFVALAIAWAVYLIPKAMRHHDEVSKRRSVDRFSNTMRVLARREPVNKRDARLVVQPGAADASTSVTVKQSSAPAAPLTPAQIRVRREATRRATARRRRVLGIILGLNVVVAALATAGVVAWLWQVAPVVLLVAWLVACRLMVRSEIAADGVLLGSQERQEPAPVAEDEAAAVPDRGPDPGGGLPADYDVDRNEQGFDEVAAEAETSTMAAVDSDLWDPLPVTLPTYVHKQPAARRSVRTIDLGEPGAWTSGRTEESAELAREADAVVESARKDDGEEPRAVGS